MGDCETVQVGSGNCDQVRQQDRAGTPGGNLARGVPQAEATPQRAVTQQQGGGRGNGNGQQVLPTVDSNLSDQEVHDLLHMREEEKLARDVYQVLGDRYDVAIFDNIAQSEQSHMDALGALIEKYKLVDPVGDNSVGVFDNDGLQSLYDSLVEKGEKSLADAYEVGVAIEVLDIDDLKIAIQATDNADIQRVYGNLLRGSQSHLAAFTSALNRVATATQSGGNSRGDLAQQHQNLGDQQQGQLGQVFQQRRDDQVKDTVRDRDRDQVFDQLGQRDRQRGRDQAEDPAEVLARDRVQVSLRARR